MYKSNFDMRSNSRDEREEVERLIAEREFKASASSTTGDLGSSAIGAIAKSNIPKPVKIGLGIATVAAVAGVLYAINK